ncbi:MAG: 30S ribosomal protein S16 [Ignavibacteria bacterium 13_1_40CM_2_61_4]|nr:MAG: 30S ribosomal protein S16 [Ignavibacteria bacterium 13_1_40CM_2_61_4]
MVKLRLRRIGKKKQPFYKIVVVDSRASRTGKYIEAIGHYNPRANPMVVDVSEPRLFLWLKRGAQPTDTLRSLLQRKGLWLKWGLMKRGADEMRITADLEKWQMLQAEKLQREGERKARRKLARKAKAPAAPAAPAAAQAEEPAAAPAEKPVAAPAEGS